MNLEHAAGTSTFSDSVSNTFDFDFLILQSSEYYLTVTEFYLNADYIMWYKNLASFVVTLLVPLLMLAFYNGTTYKLINQRYVQQNIGKQAKKIWFSYEKRRVFTRFYLKTIN